MNTSKIIQNILKDRVSNIREDLENTIAVKASELLESKKAQVAKSMFNSLDEAWGVSNAVHPSKKGMFNGRSQESIRKERDSLHNKKTRTEAESTKLKELNFALRAKTGWGKVSEEPLDEISNRKLGRYVRNAAREYGTLLHKKGLNTGYKIGKGEDSIWAPEQTYPPRRRALAPDPPDRTPRAMKDIERKAHNRQQGIMKASFRLANEEPLDESLPSDATASDYINDFVHSKNKKFSGDSKKQRIHRALGAYYGQHNEETTKRPKMTKEYLNSTHTANYQEKNKPEGQGYHTFKHFTVAGNHEYDIKHIVDAAKKEYPNYEKDGLRMTHITDNKKGITYKMHPYGIQTIKSP